MPSSTWSLAGKYRYSVATDTPARWDRSFICSASSPPAASITVAAARIRSCLPCCAAVDGMAGSACRTAAGPLSGIRSAFRGGRVWAELDTEQARQAVELVARPAKQNLVGQPVLVVQVRVVLPGKADAAVQLHGVHGSLSVGRREQHPRHCGRRREPARLRVAGAGRVAHGGITELPGLLHIGKPVLDRLERADRLTEGNPDLGVVGRHVK